MSWKVQVQFDISSFSMMVALEIESGKPPKPYDLQAQLLRRQYPKKICRYAYMKTRRGLINKCFCIEKHMALLCDNTVSISISYSPSEIKFDRHQNIYHVNTLHLSDIWYWQAYDICWFSWYAAASANSWKPSVHVILYTRTNVSPLPCYIWFFLFEYIYWAVCKTFLLSIPFTC